MEEALKAPLSKFSTMKIGGEADRLCQPQNVDELVSLVNQLQEEGEPWSIVGGGSNLLISSRGVKGTVIRTAFLKDINSTNSETLEAAAGARLPHLAKYAAQMGLSGLEFAVGIPGTVGGAVIMNAGAHGSCIANILESALVFDSQAGDIKTIPASELGFVYRNCNLDPSRHVVVSAKFKLSPGSSEEISAKTQANEDYRWRTQPIGWPNLGSTFKNPLPDKSAGYLLDKSGAKDLKIGNAAVSSLHANFVINLGGATSEEVTALLEKMKESVFNTFEIEMTPEWKTMGDFSDEELAAWIKPASQNHIS
ncbi:MAG: UDP-N-acetylmuramate dehydrogenase [Cyanobacteriota/Melainabacteria group bacterium]|nr:UDP-N-acetylmuramate dehydrogenase [Cyanobacteria bacterium HKST-UBA01]MCB9468292.1 UDP-N-acetylmuramate dehydrogenase [Candidatus Obscuribacterales bacterium]